MKFLNNYQKFLIEEFLEGKILQLQQIAPLNKKEGENWIPAGTKYKLVIIKDETNYSEFIGKEITTSNVGENIIVKIYTHAQPKSIELFSQVELINPVGRIIGNYQNELEIIADDIKLANKK